MRAEVAAINWPPDMEDTNAIAALENSFTSSLDTEVNRLQNSGALVLPADEQNNTEDAFFADIRSDNEAWAAEVAEDLGLTSAEEAQLVDDMDARSREALAQQTRTGVRGLQENFRTAVVATFEDNRGPDGDPPPEDIEDNLDAARSVPMDEFTNPDSSTNPYNTAVAFANTLQDELGISDRDRSLILHSLLDTKNDTVGDDDALRSAIGTRAQELLDSSDISTDLDSIEDTSPSFRNAWVWQNRIKPDLDELKSKFEIPDEEFANITAAVKGQIASKVIGSSFEETTAFIRKNVLPAIADTAEVNSLLTQLEGQAVIGPGGDFPDQSALDSFLDAARTTFTSTQSSDGDLDAVFTSITDQMNTPLETPGSVVTPPVVGAEDFSKPKPVEDDVSVKVSHAPEDPMYALSSQDAMALLEDAVREGSQSIHELAAQDGLDMGDIWSIMSTYATGFAGAIQSGEKLADVAADYFDRLETEFERVHQQVLVYDPDTNTAVFQEESALPLADQFRLAAEGLRDDILSIFDGDNPPTDTNREYVQGFLDDLITQTEKGSIQSVESGLESFRAAFKAKIEPLIGTFSFADDGSFKSYTPRDSGAVIWGVGALNPGDAPPGILALRGHLTDISRVLENTLDPIGLSSEALTQGMSSIIDQLSSENAQRELDGEALLTDQELLKQFVQQAGLLSEGPYNPIPLQLSLNSDGSVGFNGGAYKTEVLDRENQRRRDSVENTLRRAIGLDDPPYFETRDEQDAWEAEWNGVIDGVLAGVDADIAAGTSDPMQFNTAWANINTGLGSNIDLTSRGIEWDRDFATGTGGVTYTRPDGSQVSPDGLITSPGTPPLGGHTLTVAPPGDFGSGNALSELVFQLTANATDQFADESLLANLQDLQDVFDELKPKFQKDDEGNVIRGPNGNPILIPDVDPVTLEDFPKDSVEYQLLQAMQTRIGIGGTLSQAELELFNVSPSANSEQVSLESLITDVSLLFDTQRALVNAAIEEGKSDITFGDYLISREFETDPDTGARLTDTDGEWIPKAFETGAATTAVTQGDALTAAMTTLLTARATGTVVEGDTTFTLLQNLGVDVSDTQIFGDSAVNATDLAAAQKILKTLGSFASGAITAGTAGGDNEDLLALIQANIGGTATGPSATTLAGVDIHDPKISLDALGDPETPVAAFTPSTATTVSPGGGPVLGDITTPGVVGGAIADPTGALGGANNLAPGTILANAEAPFQTGIGIGAGAPEVSGTSDISLQTNVADPRFLTPITSGAVPTDTLTGLPAIDPTTGLPFVTAPVAPTAGFKPGAAGWGIGAGTNVVAPQQPVPTQQIPATAPTSVLGSSNIAGLLAQATGIAAPSAPSAPAIDPATGLPITPPALPEAALPGTAFLGETSRQGADVLLQELLSQSTGQLSDTQLAAERGARDAAAAGVEQFLAADPFSTGARGLRGGVSSAIAGRERGKAATAFQQQMLQNRAALQQSATQNFMALRNSLSADELARIQVGADIESQKFQRAESLMNSVAGIELQEEATRLGQEQARLDRELAAAVANADRQLQANIESARLGVEQQIATNQQRLDALIEEGRIGIAGQELQQAAEIQNQRSSLDAEIAQLGFELQAAIANQQTDLAASIEQERLRLEAQKIDADLRLGALTEEGRQQLETEALNLTRAIEQSKLLLDTSIANLNAQLASETVKANNQLTANIESQRNSLIAKQQELDALIAEGQLLIQTDALVQQGDVAELQLLLDKQKHIDTINAQLAQAERDGDIELAQTLAQLSDNEQARLLNAAIAGAELDQQDKISLREMIVDERLAEAGLRLQGILGNRKIAADVLATRTGSADFTAQLLADLSLEEKDLAIQRSSFLDQLEFAKISLEEGTRTTLATLDLQREIDASETLLTSLNMLGSLEATAGLGLLEAATSNKQAQADFILDSEGQLQQFLNQQAAGEINEEVFKDAIERADRAEVFQVSSFLSGQFLSQAALDLQQEQNATSAIAVAKQAESAFAELALTRQKIELAIQQTDDVNEQQALSNYGAAIDFLGNNLFGGKKRKDGTTIGWLQSGLSVLGGIGGFLIGGPAGAKAGAALPILAMDGANV
jgi:hypothetical protein